MYLQILKIKTSTLSSELKCLSVLEAIDLSLLPWKSKYSRLSSPMNASEDIWSIQLLLMSNVVSRWSPSKDLKVYVNRVLTNKLCNAMQLKVVCINTNPFKILKVNSDKKIITGDVLKISFLALGELLPWSYCPNFIS